MSRPPEAIRQAQAEDATTGEDRARVWRVVPWLWIVVGHAFATWGATSLLVHPDQPGWNLVWLLIGVWNIANGIRWLPTLRPATGSADLSVLEARIAANQQTLAGLIAVAEGKDQTIAELESTTARKDHEIAHLRQLATGAEKNAALWKRCAEDRAASVAGWQEHAAFWREQVADRRESLAWYQQRCDQLWEGNRTLHAQAQVLRAQLLEISEQTMRRGRGLVDAAAGDGPDPESDPAAS